MRQAVLIVNAVDGKVHWGYLDIAGGWHGGVTHTFDDAIIAASLYGFKLDRGGE